jgi:hypothetical protein
MDAAGFFLGVILVGGGIAMATGVIAVVGLLQALRGTGLHRDPPLTATSITARQRAVDARLRARYLQRHPLPRPRVDSTHDPIDHREGAPAPSPQPGSLAPERPGFIGSVVSRLAG